MFLRYCRVGGLCFGYVGLLIIGFGVEGFV